MSTRRVITEDQIQRLKRALKVIKVLLKVVIVRAEVRHHQKARKSTVVLQ